MDNFDQIVQLDGTDYIVGGTTRMDYGVTNRLLAKRIGGDAGGSAREILAVVVNQTYYTDARASQYDYNYSTSFSGSPPSNFSPVRVDLRATPTDADQRDVAARVRHRSRRHPERSRRAARCRCRTGCT